MLQSWVTFRVVPAITSKRIIPVSFINFSSMGFLFSTDESKYALSLDACVNFHKVDRPQLLGGSDKDLTEEHRIGKEGVVIRKIQNEIW
jgi:hypothetical protein